MSPPGDPRVRALVGARRVARVEPGSPAARSGRSAVDVADDRPRAAHDLARAPGRPVLDELARLVARPADVWRALERLEADGALGALVPALAACRGVGQSPYHHRDVLGHTIEVVRHAGALAEDPEPVFRSRAARVREELARPLGDGMTAAGGLMLGAVLHDMAKARTRGVTPEGRVTFLRHDRIGALMAASLLARWGASGPLRDHVAALVRHHLPLGFMVHRTPLSLRQIERYLRATDPAATETLVLSAADRMATRGPRTSEASVRRHLALAREVMEVHLNLLDTGRNIANTHEKRVRNFRKR